MDRPRAQIQSDVLRLAGLLAAFALVTTRLGLLAHELLGHGGAALAYGGDISKVRLFWFGGGWIRYDLPSDSAVVVTTGLAGIGMELLFGLTVALAVRGPGILPRLTRGAGAALVVHASAYLANGVFSGFGDGNVLYRELGAARVPLAIAAGSMACAGVYYGARTITRPLASTLSGSARQRAVGFAIAVLLAGGLHATLTFGELRLRRDATYARLMRTERDRQIAVELSTWQRSQDASGARPDPMAIEIERTRLERTHRTFPFAIVLAIAMFVALVAGIAMSRDISAERIERRWVVRAAGAAIASIAVVIVLGFVLPG